MEQRIGRHVEWYGPGAPVPDIGYLIPTITRISLKVPQAASTGTHYVFVCADAGNIIFETDESNNCNAQRIDVFPPNSPNLSKWPDLHVPEMSTRPSTSRPNDYVELSFSVNNAGTATSRVGEHYLVWSTDPIMNGEDRVLGTVAFAAFAPHESRSYTVSLQVPPDASGGEYFLGVCSGAVLLEISNLGESNQANNCSSTPVQISSAKASDLTVSRVSVPAKAFAPGEPVLLSFVSTNAGNAGVENVTYAVRWSADSVITDDDAALALISWGGMNAASAYEAGPFKIVVPGTAASGTYYIAVCADYGRAVVEVNEQNNCSGIPIVVKTEGEPESISVVVDPGSVRSLKTGGTDSRVIGGYASIRTIAGTAAYGQAIFSFRENGVTTSEIGVPASGITVSARFVAELRSRFWSQSIEVNTGVAIVNPGSVDTLVSLTLRDAEGRTVSSGMIPIKAGEHLARFMTDFQSLDPVFVVPLDFDLGTIEVSCTQPVSVLPLRLVVNQRGETLLTVMPVTDLTNPILGTPAYLPHFASGGGYTNITTLMNTSAQVETGEVRFRDDRGSPADTTLPSGRTGSAFAYSIPPNGVVRMETIGNQNVKVGSIEIFPTAGSVPAAGGVFRLTQNNTVVTETGVPSTGPVHNARLYVDLSNGHNTGVALSNPRATIVALEVILLDPNGRQLAIKQLTLPARGHISIFVNELFTDVPNEFTGQMVVRVVPATGTDGINVTAFRSLRNERGEFVLTTLPVSSPLDVAAPSAIFPHLVNGGGYTTEIILLNSDAQTTSFSRIEVHADDGQIFSFRP